MTRARLRRGRDGRWQLRLAAEERELLGSLPGQASKLMAEGDPSTARLFPPAYAQDVEEEAEYRRLVGDQLLESHRAALSVLAETAHADHLDDDQVNAWLGAVNDLRLVLGTSLDVSEDFRPLARDDPRAPAMATYVYLSVLQEEIVEALSGQLGSGLPRPGRPRGS